MRLQLYRRDFRISIEDGDSYNTCIVIICNPYNFTNKLN